VVDAFAPVLVEPGAAAAAAAAGEVVSAERRMGKKVALFPWS